jgi:hypothetical protein
MNESQVKHLEMLQAVITRMNTNSFMIKGWMITLVSAIFALSAKDANQHYVIITYICIPAFWLLDAFYLSQERQYRALYDAMRTRQDTDFSMDASKYREGRNTWLRSFFSTTLLVTYLSVAILILLVMLYIS